MVAQVKRMTNSVPKQSIVGTYLNPDSVQSELLHLLPVFPEKEKLARNALFSMAEGPIKIIGCATKNL